VQICCTFYQLVFSTSHHAVDSFSGLPAEASGIRLEGPHWKPGGFSAADALKEYSLPALLAKLKEYINHSNVTLIPGYFNHSLTPGLRQQFPFRPALLVDIDVDLYSSSIQCLSWLFEQRILRAGSFVRYDDWRQIGQLHGEARAHKEASLRYNVTWRNLGGGYEKGVLGLNSREWQVVSVGSPHGVPWDKRKLERAMRAVQSPEGMWRSFVRP
jgi:hypothetical protein